MGKIQLPEGLQLSPFTHPGGTAGPFPNPIEAKYCCLIKGAGVIGGGGMGLVMFCEEQRWQLLHSAARQLRQFAPQHAF